MGTLSPLDNPSPITGQKGTFVVWLPTKMRKCDSRLCPLFLPFFFLEGFPYTGAANLFIWLESDHIKTCNIFDSLFRFVTILKKPQPAAAAAAQVLFQYKKCFSWNLFVWLWQPLYLVDQNVFRWRSITLITMESWNQRQYYYRQCC